MGMKIGIFDSGLGGLSVLNEALSKLSEHEFLYYADVKMSHTDKRAGMRS